ncbi:MAG: hypothetical protein IM492_20835 [Microcystis sp. M040S2]|nr:MULTISPECIES: hypothetical protein [unclassified Microcystis]MCA2621926.1 hypothetical protein [Microcystis sp. M099S2]MCA2869168.1 hypothetical protein [Microcystis sp. M058S1]MCA2872962.1 hypothetical protein [Microcystis sp. M055S1]MCA2913436.1 hypothetical protein [Microcystis sp. M022S1]MCA2926562.1 hypothetical protein [Microcystis sp. M020S1]MCA2930949.1 hypothetical protein [Microcystis sp. M018S1]
MRGVGCGEIGVWGVGIGGKWGLGGSGVWGVGCGVWGDRGISTNTPKP